jgi:RNA polymerase sigma-70 factor (ECF subfamily)
VWKETDRLPIPAQSDVDWKVVVERIRAGDPTGEEALYRNLAAGARLFLQRRLGTREVEDQVHDLFLIVVETIRRGELREPERLMGFVRTVLNRQLNREISRIIRNREISVDLESATGLTAADPSPEQQAAGQQKLALIKQVLRKMNRREFEVLTRFYLREQSPEQICMAMTLTRTQFDLLKSRAKARLTDLVQRKLVSNPPSRR